MTSLCKLATRLMAAGVLISGLAAGAFAQDDKQGADRQKNETTMTGCLNKDASGGYVLTDEKTGMKQTVTGSADLEKHSTNHKVTLTGMSKTDANGKPVFEVTKISHVSPTCKASPE